MSLMRATAVAHPNVALIKYWGKRPAATANLPAVDSLSITLGALRSETTVSFDPGLQRDRLLLDGNEPPAEQERLAACLDAVRELAGSRLRARVESVNDFPTGAGLASSASGYAALAVAAAAALGLDPADPCLARAARIGSGSAPRSLFGGFVELRSTDTETSCRQVLDADSWPLQVVIAVTAEQGKPVSSRDGMRQSRDTSPFYEDWLSTHAADMELGLQSVGNRDFDKLAEVAEHNCLKMHAVMMTTRPPLLYWLPATLACVHAIRDMRARGLGVFFTIDAGPQVKAVCLPDAADRVERELAGQPGVLRTIRGGLGGGPVVTDRA